MAATRVDSPASVDRALWRTAQALGVLLTIALLAGLVFRPALGLRLLWYGAIPVLPMVFLLQPKLWRNVCPLATLNALPGRRTRGLRLNAGMARWTTPAGIALLIILVPARRFLLNTDGLALAGVIVAVALLALAAGFLFDRKAGFCNSICPVLPVERLYGQSPVARLETAHCATCSLCTARGCLDLAPEKSIPQVLGAARQTGAWVRTPYGAFAAAFPGFVVAYYLVGDVTLAEAGRVYLVFGGAMAMSWLLVAAGVAVARAPAHAALPTVGALALLLYYWLGAPGIAESWGLGTGTVHGIRGLGFLLLVSWLALRLRAPQPAKVRARG